jgi:hypothetical protein
MPLGLQSGSLRAYALLCFVLLPVLSAHGEWPVKKFQVFLGSPGPSAPSVLGQVAQAISGDTDPDTPIAPGLSVTAIPVREIEAYLEQAAAALDRAGFRQPKLQRVVQTPAGPAFRIYLYDYPLAGVSPLAYRVDCTGTQLPFIRIHLSHNVRAGKLTREAYSNLGHELFHAVQHGYEMFQKHCNLGDWIVEGTAQAVGIDLMRSLLGVDFPNETGAWAQQRWGLRRYSDTLWIGDDDKSRDDEDYGTSSLWRYLGEHFSSGGSTGLSPVEPNYSYLAEFFAAGLSGDPGQTSEINWLHQRLLAKMGNRFGLERLYPRFITTFASYVNNRFKPDPANAPSLPDAKAAEDRWLTVLFRQCPVLTLSPSQRVRVVTLDLPAISAGCVRVEAQFDIAVDLAIHLIAAPGQSLSSIVVGTEDGQVISTPVPVEGSGAGLPAIGYLGISIDPKTRKKFVLSNIAGNPAATKPIRFQLELSVPGHLSNMTDPAGTPTGVRARPIPGSQTADPGRITLDSQTQRVGNQVQSALEKLNPNLTMGNAAYRNPDGTPCDEPFVDGPCGASTRLNLASLPGSMASLENTTGRGGFFGQFASTMMGLGAGGVLETNAAFQRAQQSMWERDGSEISIQIPMIDYGFTGTFNNASIEVSRAGGRRYRAVGPDDIQPGPGYRFPLSGSVNIESYTPTLMKGTFSAQLTDTDAVDFAGDDMTLPIHARISGSFSIAAPWRGDPRVQRGIAKASEADLKADLVELFPGAEAQVDRAITEAERKRAGGSNRGYSLEGGALRCNCSCNYAATADEKCKQECALVFKACSGQRAPKPPQASEPARQSAEKELRQKFADLILKTFGPRDGPSMQKSLLSAFDTMKTLEEKRTMYASFGGKLP